MAARSCQLPTLCQRLGPEFTGQEQGKVCLVGFKSCERFRVHIMSVFYEFRDCRVYKALLEARLIDFGFDYCYPRSK